MHESRRAEAISMLSERHIHGYLIGKLWFVKQSAVKCPQL